MPTGLNVKESIMKKVLSFLLVVLILIGTSALVSCDYELTLQKKAKTREANLEDIYVEFDYEEFYGQESHKLTFKLQVNESIEDLVLHLNLETEDGKVLKTITHEVGRVVPGNQYKYQIDVSDMSLNEIKATYKITLRIADGYVIIQ